MSLKEVKEEVGYYDKITSIDQRKIYKAYFDSEYPTYCNLCESVKRVFDRFKALKDILEESQEGTEEHKSAVYLVRITYTKYLQDPNYINVLRKLNVLHEKLGCIKKLVKEYDKEQLNQFNTK
ncbi:hypothetical protein TNCV_4627281 [Trichonephila clavipes]|nr:hypothetical protein TNCV_4627281 [Trichonephila clavipes]